MLLRMDYLTDFYWYKAVPNLIANTKDTKAKISATKI